MMIAWFRSRPGIWKTYVNVCSPWRRISISTSITTMRPSWLPRVLGALVALAGVGYVADATGTVLSADYDTNVAAFTFFGEPLLMLWLLVHGWRAVRRPTIDLVEASA